MTALRKDRTLSGTLLISLLFHGMLLVLLAGVVASHSTGKSVYLTEVTLLGEMPYGKGLGQKGDVSGKTGVKSGKTAAKPEKIASKIMQKRALSKQAVVQRSPDDIVKLHKETPIGMDESAMKNSDGPLEGPVLGGGYGEDSENPGMADGNLEISGPIASRGIIRQFMPGYPEWAKRQGIEGAVQVQITVKPGGDVKDVIVIKTCGFKEMDFLVSDGMTKWKFDSLPLSARQIDQEGKITFKFNLKK